MSVYYVILNKCFILWPAKSCGSNAHKHKILGRIHKVTLPKVSHTTLQPEPCRFSQKPEPVPLSFRKGPKLSSTSGQDLLPKAYGLQPIRIYDCRLELEADGI